MMLYRPTQKQTGVARGAQYLGRRAGVDAGFLARPRECLHHLARLLGVEQVGHLARVEDAVDVLEERLLAGTASRRESEVRERGRGEGSERERGGGGTWRATRASSAGLGSCASSRARTCRREGEGGVREERERSEGRV